MYKFYGTKLKTVTVVYSYGPYPFLWCNRGVAVAV